MIPYIVGLAVFGLGSSLLFEEKRTSKQKLAPSAVSEQKVIPFLAAEAEGDEQN